MVVAVQRRQGKLRRTEGKNLFNRICGSSSTLQLEKRCLA